jgi:hypothetical protein
MSPAELYEEDFYEWTVRNAELLRSGRASEADLTNIAEELESLGRHERRALLSRLSVLMAHLLKWKAQYDRRSRSWEITIREQRKAVSKLLKESPSLKTYLKRHLAEAYERAVGDAALETRLPEEDFPPTCPFTLEVLLDLEYLP